MPNLGAPRATTRHRSRNTRLFSRSRRGAPDAVARQALGLDPHVKQAASERILAKVAMVRPLDSFPVPSVPGPRRPLSRGSTTPADLVSARLKETAAIAIDRRASRRVEAAAVSPGRSFPRTFNGIPSRHRLPASLTAPLPPVRRRANISRTPPSHRRDSPSHLDRSNRFPPLRATRRDTERVESNVEFGSSQRTRSPSRRATSAWPSGSSSPRVCRRRSGARSSSAPATQTRRSSLARSA